MFQCSLDYQAYFDCGEGTSSSWTGNNLDDGPHSFVVIARDEMDNSGRHTRTWTQGMMKLQATRNMILFYLCNDVGRVSFRY